MLTNVVTKCAKVFHYSSPKEIIKEVKGNVMYWGFAGGKWARNYNFHTKNEKTKNYMSLWVEIRPKSGAAPYFATRSNQPPWQLYRVDYELRRTHRAYCFSFNKTVFGYHTIILHRYNTCTLDLENDKHNYLLHYLMYSKW